MFFSGLNPTSDYFVFPWVFGAHIYSCWFVSWNQLKPGVRILNVFLFCSLVSLTPFNFFLILPDKERDFHPDTTVRVFFFCQKLGHSFNNGKSLENLFETFFCLLGSSQLLPPFARIDTALLTSSLLQKHFARWYPHLILVTLISNCSKLTQNSWLIFLLSLLHWYLKNF